MAEINTVIADASQDLQTIEDFVNLPADSEVYPRLLPSVNVGTLAGTRQAIFEAGGLPATPFATKALMEASELVDGDYAQVTDGGVNNGLYVKTEGVWVKSGYDPVVQAKTYTDNEIVQINSTLRKKQSVFDTHEDLLQAGLRHNDPALVVADSDSSRNGFYSHSGSVPYRIPFQPQDIAKAYTNSLFSSKLTTTTNLNELLTGVYYISSADMNSIFDDGTFATLGYPLKMVRGGGAVVEITRSSGNGSQSFQKITYTSQGEFFTRSGIVGGVFTTWAKAVVLQLGSIKSADTLNDFVTAGQWGIAATVVAAGSLSGTKGYPIGLSASASNLSVSVTDTGNAVQVFTHLKKQYRRVIKVSDKSIVEAWGSLSGGGAGSYATVALGLSSVEDGETFWVYPTPENGILTLTFYKRLDATTSEVVFTQKNPLDEFLITQNTKWEIV